MSLIWSIDGFCEIDYIIDRNRFSIAQSYDRVRIQDRYSMYFLGIDVSFNCANAEFFYSTTYLCDIYGLAKVVSLI